MTEHPRPMIRILTERPDLRTRLAELYAKRGDDMARPTLTVGRSTIIGAREIAAHQAKVAALAQKGDA
jgi:hypothetical protein